MVDSDPQQNLYSSLVELKFRENRNTPLWRADVQRVLASSQTTIDLAEVVRKLPDYSQTKTDLSEGALASSSSKLEDVWREIGGVIDIAIQLAGRQLSAGAIDRMVDEAVKRSTAVPNVVEQAVWNSGLVRTVKWLLAVVGPAVVAFVVGGTVWGVVQVQGINQQIEASKTALATLTTNGQTELSQQSQKHLSELAELRQRSQKAIELTQSAAATQAEAALRQIQNVSQEFERKFDAAISTELATRKAAADSAFSALESDIRAVKNAVASASGIARAAFADTTKDVQGAADRAKLDIKAVPATVVEQQQDLLKERRRQIDEAAGRILASLDAFAKSTDDRAREAQATLDRRFAEITKVFEDAKASLDASGRTGAQRIVTEADQQLVAAKSAISDGRSKGERMIADETSKQVAAIKQQVDQQLVEISKALDTKRQDVIRQWDVRDSNVSELVVSRQNAIVTAINDKSKLVDDSYKQVVDMFSSLIKRALEFGTTFNEQLSSKIQKFDEQATRRIADFDSQVQPRMALARSLADAQPKLSPLLDQIEKVAPLDGVQALLWVLLMGDIMGIAAVVTAILALTLAVIALARRRRQHDRPAVAGN